MAHRVRGRCQKPSIPVLWNREGREMPLAISIAGGIQHMAGCKGYDVQLYERIEEILADEQANQRVMVIGLENSCMPAMLNTLQEAKKQVVVTSMDMDHIDSHYSCATFSRRIATDQMLDYLAEKGCRRIALVGCGDLSINDMVCSDALKKYLARRRLEGDCFYFHKRIEESFSAFYAKREDFDGVICPSDFAAVLFLRFCEQKGVAIPRDFLLAALKDNYISRYCKPSLTTLATNFFAIGENAVVIWDQLRQLGSEDIQMRITVPGRIIERESTFIDKAIHLDKESSHFFANHYQGGPFYQEPMVQKLMQFERCLRGSDELDLRIISLIIQGLSYENISEALFLSDSSLQYRVRKIFRVAQVENRRSFVKLISGCFTRENNFDAK